MLRMWRDVLIVVGFLCLAFIPWDLWFSSKVSLRSMLLLPSTQHWLGTDNMGRDLLVRSGEAISGAVLPFWLGVCCATALGFSLSGLVLAFAQRSWSQWVQKFMRGISVCLGSIPVGIASFLAVVFLGTSSLWAVILAAGGLFLIRSYGQVIDLYERDRLLEYWCAHDASGGSPGARILQYGFLGNWRAVLLDTFGFHLRVAVVVEASLSYLGFGIHEPAASFGNMLASHFDSYLKGQFFTLIVIVGMLFLAAAFPTSLVTLIKRMGRKTTSHVSKDDGKIRSEIDALIGYNGSNNQFLR